MSGSVTLAFAPEDAALATGLASALQARGVSVTDSIDTSDLLVVLYGRSTFTCDAVTSALLAATSDDLPILPVVLDDEAFTDESLTSSFRYFAAGIGRVHASELAPEAMHDLTSRAVKKLLDERLHDEATAPRFDRHRARRDLEMRYSFARRVRVGWLERAVIVWMFTAAWASTIGMVVFLGIVSSRAYVTGGEPGSMSAYLIALQRELRFLAMTGFLLLQSASVVSLWAIGSWAYKSYDNVRALGRTPHYSNIGVFLRIMLPYVWPWAGYWIWRDLTLIDGRATPRVAKLIAVWTVSWPICGLLSGYVGSRGGPAAPDANVFLVTLSLFLWIVTHVVSIPLVRTSGRAQREAWARARTSSNIGTVATAKPTDVLVAYPPHVTRAAQLCVSGLERRGVRCWLRDAASNDALPTGFRALLLIWSTDAADDPDTSRMPTRALDARLPTIVVDTDGAAATDRLLQDLRWRHWSDGRAMWDEELDAIAASIYLLQAPAAVASIDSTLVRRAREVLGEPALVNEPPSVAREGLRYATLGIQAFCGFASLLIALGCWPVLRVALEQSANVLNPLRFLNTAGWLVGCAGLLPFVSWWIAFGRNLRTLRRARVTAAPRTPWLLGAASMAWLLCGAVTLMLAYADRFAAAAITQAVSALVLTVLFFTCHLTMRQREAWLEHQLEGVMGTTASDRRGPDMERFSLLGSQATAVAIVAVVGTVFLISSTLAHRDIPSAIRFEAATNQVVSTFPSAETDTEQVRQFSADVTGFAIVALALGVWIHQAWSNLTLLRRCGNVTPLTAALRSVLPIRNVLSSRRVLSQLWSTAGDDLASSPTPVIVRFWQLLVVIVPAAWITAIARRHDPSYWLIYAAGASAGVAALWLLTYFVYMVRERQIEQMIDIESQRDEQRYARHRHQRRATEPGVDVVRPLTEWLRR
jgi:hypothetical protein